MCSIGLLCYGILGMLGIVMPTISTLLLDRFLLGVTTAAVMTSSTALISDYFQGNKRLRMIAVQGMAIEVGGIVFLSMGGFLAEFSGHGPFFIYAIAFVAWLWLHYFIPSANKKTEETDIMSQEQEEELLHTGKIWPVIMLTFLAMFIFFSGIVSLPVLLQVTLGYSKSFTGNYLAFISLTAVITAGIMPRVVKAITAKGTLAVAFCSFCVAFSLFALLHDVKWMVVAVVFTGIGFGLTIPLLNHLPVERSPSEHRGRYLGFYSTANFGGQFFSSITTTFVSGSVSFGIVVALAIVNFLFVILIFRNK